MPLWRLFSAMRRVPFSVKGNEGKREKGNMDGNWANKGNVREISAKFWKMGKISRKYWKMGKIGVKV